MTKRIILVLVEGSTDEDALALVFETAMRYRKIQRAFLIF